MSTNSLHKQYQCPECNSAFIGGYDPHDIHQCPSCKHKFMSQKKKCKPRFVGGSNAFYRDGCPAIMSDGRFITNYNSANELTEAIKQMNGISNSNELRQFLQNNGNKIINAERNYHLNDNKCNPSTACSEGWQALWKDHRGNWSNLDHHY